MFHGQTCRVAALAVEYKTPDNYGYQYFWFNVGTRESVVFSVVACKEVHVALAQFPGTSRRCHQSVRFVM